jgi:hypothetical protein
MVWWLLLRDRDDEEADAEDGFTSFQNYRRFRSLLRAKRKKSRELSGRGGAKVPSRATQKAMNWLAILLLALCVLVMVSR